MRSDLQNKGIELARRAAHSRPARKLADAIREEPSGPPEPVAPELEPEEIQVDGWLTSLFSAELEEIDAKLGSSRTGPEAYELFRDLDDDLWALLLSRQYSCYPNILALLPDLPEPSLQVNWNGAHGLALLEQSNAFYRHVKAQYSVHHDGELADARILDFGCGWGRLTRFFTRDVPPGALLGCDPVEDILDVCRESRLPAKLHHSEFVPSELPVGGIDLAFSFSVFTHISERSATTCLDALHGALNPGGLLIVTIRPPAYLDLDARMHDARDALEPDPLTALAEPRYVFAPHPVEGGHPQYEGGEMTYGESVVSLPYIREKWTKTYELLDVKVNLEDIYQVAVTLRKR